MEISIEEICSFFREMHIFAKLSDDEVAAAADRVEVFSVPAGEVIFSPGARSDGLYFIYQGKVKVSATPGKGSAGAKRTLAYGDCFGEEVLVYGQLRLTQAVSQTDSVVIRVSKRNLNKWIDDFPKLLTPLRLVEESFFLVYNRPFSWLAKDEKVKFASRRTKFILWRKLLAPACLLSVLLTITIYLLISQFFLLSVVTAGLLLLLVPWAAWLIVDWRNDFLVVTNRRIVCVEKVLLLYDTRHETPLEAVQSFGVETDQWGRWFGFGSVVVRSFTGNQLLKEIQNPPEIINVLEEALERSKSHRKEEDKRMAEAAVRVRLGLDSQNEAGGEKEADGQPAFFQAGTIPDWAANLFQMRVESGDTITYRTHWLKLFQSLFLPTLLLLLIPAMLVVGFSLENPMFSDGLISLAAVMVWVVTFAIWIYRYVDWHNDCYVITPDQLIDIYRKPLGTEERRTASYSSVLGIEYARKGLLGMLLNFGTVFIKIGDTNFTFDNVYNPSLVQQELFQKLNAFLLHEKKAAAEEERERMADFIETYHKLYKGERSPMDETSERD